MEHKVIKVKNSSDYWIDFERDTSEYLYKWRSVDSKKELEKYKFDFLFEYMMLTIKYGMAIPNFIDLEVIKIEDKVREVLKKNISKYPDNWMDFHFNILYSNSYELFNSSILFIKRNGDILKERIVNVDFLYNYDEVIKDPQKMFAYPIKINFSKDYIYLSITNDVFFLELDNKKCKDFDYPVENSELAYLNTPRLNSFLRDLKNLCFKYGATDFEFYNLHDDNSKEPKYFSQKGILFNNEVLYYEDVYDLLDKKYRI